MSERDIFIEALQIETDADRAAFLDSACGDDADLRQRVDELLAQHHRDGSFFLDAPAPNIVVTADMPEVTEVTERPGDTIGPYKLLQQIGEGGMGVVYMAEQTEPVERRVALKIIKPGMDTRQVIARFEAERQALAMMDHPNIARVLDAGTTGEPEGVSPRRQSSLLAPSGGEGLGVRGATGRPYFVMELVKGLPITQYCDEQHLTPRERLELFLPICQAVQHAHQKGVIHRDLKPSNILIARYDDRAVPKIIDFGVAKAVSQRLTEKTMFTQYGQIVGTIEYMSPEQAQFNQLDVDTRSDIYSLGVLLYELLTGETPFDKQRLRTAAFDELLRIIREEEPPRPSTRLSSSQTLPSIAANRKIEPHRLSTLVRGELDWIVMKALEKDRTRRYETASAFASDVQHYLNDEAVVACPPSAGYRFRKFARRNRSAMGATAAALLVLVAVAIGSSIAAGRFRALAQQNAELLGTAVDAEAAASAAEEQERLQRIEAEEQTEIARDALADASRQRDRAAANFVLARSAVDEFLSRVTEEELLEDPGLHELRRELLESGVEFYEEFIRDEANASELLLELAGAHYRIGRIRNELGGQGEGRPSIEKSIELFEQLRNDGHDSLDVRLGLAKAYQFVDRDEDAVALCREILETNPQHAATRQLLGAAFNSLAVWPRVGETISQASDADLEHGLAYIREAVRIREELVRDFPDNPQYLADLGDTLSYLAFMLHMRGAAHDSIDLLQRAVSYMAQAYSQEPRWGAGLSIDLSNLALIQRTVKDHDAALESFERLVQFRRRLVFDNPRVPRHKARLYKAWMELANQQQHLNRADDAERSFQAAQEVLENMPRKEAFELFDLAVVYAALATGAEHHEQQQLADQAMESLVAAADEGFRDVRMLESTRTLDVLRDRAEFQQLVTRVKREAETLELEHQLGDGRQSLELVRELIGNDPSAAQHDVALATALHSIAIVQMQIGQFDEAEQSLNEALELHRQLPVDGDNNRFRRFDAIKTQLSLGQLYRMLDRWPQAHLIWQECLAALAALAGENRDDPDLQTQIGLLEITTSNGYGSLGLWDQAAEHARRSVQFERVDDREIVWACRHASLLPDRVPDDRLQQYIERLEQHIPGNLQPAARLDPRQHLVWTAGLVAPDALLPDRFVELMQPRANAGLVRFWDQLTMALAQHRAGQHAKALETLEKTNADWTTLERAATLSAAYLLALTAHSTGDAARAEARLRQSEDLYRNFCRRTLRLTQSELAAPYTSLWWELPAAQSLRREAWETIMDSPAADPWQHLIQARGYRIIGETDKADAEMAAAVSAAPDDPLVWLAHLELLDQWGEIARADSEQVEWERVVELAGDDPAAWMYRGRWHAEQGDYNQAAADFDHALGLVPDRELVKPRPRRRPVYWTAIQWDTVYDRLGQMRPDDLDLPCELGLHHAVQARFDAALEAFRRGNPEPGAIRRQAHLAMLLLLNDRRDEYVERCRSLERTYRTTGWSDDRMYFSALIGTVGPDSGIELQTFRDWSDRLWNDGDPQSNNAVRAAGACSFRAGDTDLARQLLERAHHLQAEAAIPEFADLDHFLLAMIHHQLGNSSESHQWYDRGVAALARWRDTPNPSTQLIPYLWLQMNVQYREATALLGIPPGEQSFQIAREPEPEE